MNRSRTKPAVGLFLVLLCCTGNLIAVEKDTPFIQDSAVKYSVATELRGAAFQRLQVERDGIVYVLTDRGLTRVFENRLALDRSFRPLAGLRPLDIALREGHLFYLYADKWLANESAGKPFGQLPVGVYHQLAVADDGTVLVAGEAELGLFKDGRLQPIERPSGVQTGPLFTSHNEFFLILKDAVYRVTGNRCIQFHQGKDLTTLAFRAHELLVGTKNGYYSLDLQSGREILARQTELPCADITCLLPINDALWVGTTRGAFHKTSDGRTDYYASQRWLSDDHVLAIQPDDSGDILILTRTGLNRIHFQSMTLAAKAAFYDRKIRLRHNRFGFCSELRLLTPGDIASAEMIDTDNDGTWSNYYLASQAFRYGATGDEEARSNAWETFAALERLESTNPLGGFPARTYERLGFKYSDPERWHPVGDGEWEWKAHTSSDEITAHAFGCAVLYETTAKTDLEKARIATFFDKIMSHLMKNNWYLIDVDGKPTLWGRWNPEYVNWYPHTIIDRRINSAEIIGMLEFAHKITGKVAYREAAFGLLEREGYRDNITSSVTEIRPTKGFVHQGEDMGNEWNHSDDLLSFVAYWTLHRFAFNPKLKATFAAAIQDHWELEKSERCPVFNFIYAATGTKNYDLAGALWTLRRFPLDMIDWTVQNSQRQDITRAPENFRGQQLMELLPPGERRIMRWNGNPFTLDGGSGGSTELAGDEFLLPYWMARYLKLIE